MKLVWGPRAKRDYEELIGYIAEQSVQAASLVAQRIGRAAELLEGLPGMGRPGRVAGTRELVVPQTPYILAYRVNTGTIRVLRVFRGARRWPARFE
jgi:toxin ParE1/3/4